MKKIVVTSLALALSLSLVACGQPSTDTETSPSPSTSVSPSPEVDVQVDFEAFMTSLEKNVMMPALMSGDLTFPDYGFAQGDVEEFLVRVPMMAVSAAEYGIFKGDTAAIQAGIEQRLAELEASWSTYLPEQLALVEACSIYTNGDYVMYIICEEADKVYAENQFNRLFDDSIQELVRPVSFTMANGTVVEVLDNGLVLDLEVEGEIYTVNGTYADSIFIDSDYETGETLNPQVGDALSVSFESEVVVEEDTELEGQLIFVGRWIDYGMGNGDAGVGDMGMGDMGMGDMGMGDMGVGDMGIDADGFAEMDLDATPMQ